MSQEFDGKPTALQKFCGWSHSDVISTGELAARFRTGDTGRMKFLKATA